MIEISGAWLESRPAQSVLGLLSDAGHQALFVGGCVRNALLDAPVTDLDIATDALPERVLELAENAGLKAVPTGLAHGTITIIIDSVPFEITTFRRDVETDGRHAVVAFTNELVEDARRRDFTMNALYADRHGHVVDPLGGLADLEQRRIRFIGSPDARIEEDYLRILRFFRFHAWYADPFGGMDTDGLDACARFAERLAGISKERIGAELLKLLKATDPAPSLGAMQKTGVLQHVLPGSDPRAAFLVIASHPVDPVLRLAAMGAPSAPEDLRLSNADAHRLKRLRGAAEASTQAPSLGYSLGETDAIAALHLRAALLEQPVDMALVDQAKYGARQVFPIRAADLMPRYEGAALGKRLKQLEEAWLASNFQLTKSELMRL